MAVASPMPCVACGAHRATGLGADPVLSKNPIDAVRRADSTLDARRVATFVTAENLCSARPVCRLFPTNEGSDEGKRLQLQL